MKLSELDLSEYGSPNIDVSAGDEPGEFVLSFSWDAKGNASAIAFDSFDECRWFTWWCAHNILNDPLRRKRE